MTQNKTKAIMHSVPAERFDRDEVDEVLMTRRQHLMRAIRPQSRPKVERYEMIDLYAEMGLDHTAKYADIEKQYNLFHEAFSELREEGATQEEWEQQAAKFWAPLPPDHYEAFRDLSRPQQVAAIWSKFDDISRAYHRLSRADSKEIYDEQWAVYKRVEAEALDRESTPSLASRTITRRNLVRAGSTAAVLAGVGTVAGAGYGTVKYFIDHMNTSLANFPNVKAVFEGLTLENGKFHLYVDAKNLAPGLGSDFKFDADNYAPFTDDAMSAAIVNSIQDYMNDAGLTYIEVHPADGQHTTNLYVCKAHLQHTSGAWILRSVDDNNDDVSYQDTIFYKDGEHVIAKSVVVLNTNLIEDKMSLAILEKNGTTPGTKAYEELQKRVRNGFRDSMEYDVYEIERPRHLYLLVNKVLGVTPEQMQGAQR